MLPLYSFCSVFALCYYVVFCRVQPIFNHHYKITYLCQNTTTTNYVIYLFRVRVSFAVEVD